VALGTVLHVAGFRGSAAVQSRAIPPLAVQLDPVRRIGNEQQRLGIAQQPRDHIRLRAVAADYPVASENEQVAQSCDGLRLHFGNGVLVDQAGSSFLRLEQPLEFDVVEPDQIEVVILFVENRQFDAQHFFVPGCTLESQLVIRDDERSALGRRKVAEHDDRHFFHPEFLGRQQTRMARDDVVVRSHEDWVCPPPLAHGRRDAGDLFARGIRRSIGQRSI
jgi:hypothetical protein